MASSAKKKKPDLTLVFGMGGKPKAEGKGGLDEMPPLPEEEEDEEYDDLMMEDIGEEVEEEEPTEEGELDDESKGLAATALGNDDPVAAQALKDFVKHCVKTYG